MLSQLMCVVLTQVPAEALKTCAKSCADPSAETGADQRDRIVQS